MRGVRSLIEIEMTLLLLLVAIIVLGLLYAWDALIVLPGLILGLSFIYVWGAAPCWQFERCWREKYSRHPEEAALISVGLAPKSRRQASGLLFTAVALLAFCLAWIMSSSDFNELALSGVAAALVGTVAGLALHHFGQGRRRVRAFFEDIK